MAAFKRCAQKKAGFKGNKVCFVDFHRSKLKIVSCRDFFEIVKKK